MHGQGSLGNAACHLTAMHSDKAQRPLVQARRKGRGTRSKHSEGQGLLSLKSFADMCLIEARRALILRPEDMGGLLLLMG